MTTDLEYLRNTGWDEQDGFTSYHSMKYDNLKTEINSYVWNHNHAPVSIGKVTSHFSIPRRLAQIILDELSFQGYMSNVQMFNSRNTAYQSIYESDE